MFAHLGTRYNLRAIFFTLTREHAWVRRHAGEQGLRACLGFRIHIEQASPRLLKAFWEAWGALGKAWGMPASVEKPDITLSAYRRIG